MILSILQDRFHFISDGPSDILIFITDDTVILSLYGSDYKKTVPRPITSSALHIAADSLAKSVFHHPFTADPSTNSAVLGSLSVKLTSTEFRMYSAILENKNEYISADELSEKVWKRKDRNLCTVYISYLRHKLNGAFGDGTLITISGKGYRLCNTVNDLGSTP